MVETLRDMWDEFRDLFRLALYWLLMLSLGVGLPVVWGVVAHPQWWLMVLVVLGELLAGWLGLVKSGLVPDPNVSRAYSVAGHFVGSMMALVCCAGIAAALMFR